MGTRNLTAVVIDGDFKIAQYGQWDGYPTGQGATIVKFLGDTADRAERIEALRENARKLRWATDEDFARINTELGLGEGGWMDMEQAKRYETAYPNLTRNTGAGILQLVADGQVEFVNDQRDFALDSLFCEWAYVLDLDAGTLEVYRGFQTKRHDQGRWAGLPTDEDIAAKEAEAKADLDKGEIDQRQYEYRAKTEYHAIALLATYDLATVDDLDMEAAQALAYPEDND